MRGGAADSTYLVAGCFGKLPFSPEYLDVNVVLPVSRLFRDWIRNGRQTAGMGPDGGEGRVPPERSAMRFLYAPSSSGEMLAGVIRPSADIGEKRQFPFTVFVHVPRRSWSRSYALLPLALNPVWDALDDLWESLATATSERAFREILTAARVPVPMAAAEAKVTYEAGQGEIAARVFDPERGTSVEALRTNLPDLLRSLKARPQSMRVELPAGADHEAASYDTAFWIDLFNRQFFWKRFEPTIFLGGAPRQVDRSAFLLFGDPEPGDYARLMGIVSDHTAYLRPAHRPAGSPPSVFTGTAPTYADLASTRFVA